MSYSDAPTTLRPARAHEWTVDKQRGFLDALADHGRVMAAADAVGMSAASAYRLRARDTAFAFGWRAAAALAYERLRELALDRATNGVLTPRHYHGTVVSETVHYSDRLLLGLLAHLKPEGGVDPRTGKRGVALPPAELWAMAVDAYDTATETGAAPVKPHIASEDGPAPGLTREQMIARIVSNLQKRAAADAAAAAGDGDDGFGGFGGAAGAVGDGGNGDAVGDGGAAGNGGDGAAAAGDGAGDCGHSGTAGDLDDARAADARRSVGGEAGTRRPDDDGRWPIVSGPGTRPSCAADPLSYPLPGDIRNHGADVTLE